MKTRQSPLTRVAEKLADDARSYAKRYNCSLIEAISDRGYPANSQEIALALELLDIEPDRENIRACYPDSDERVERYIHEEIRDWEPRPGEWGYRD